MVAQWFPKLWCDTVIRTGCLLTAVSSEKAKRQHAAIHTDGATGAAI